MASSAASMTVFILCWIIINLVIFPYEAYWTYRLWLHRSTLIIAKRRPKLLVLDNATVWLSNIFFFSTVGIMCEIYDYSLASRAYIIFTLLSNPLVVCCYGLYILRYWLVFFHVKHSAGVIQSQWQSVIRSTSDSANWYVRYASSFGSAEWFRTYLLPTCGLAAALYYTVLTIVLSAGASKTVLMGLQTLWSFAVLLWVLLSIALYFFILRKLPIVEDPIGVRQELRFSALGIVVSLLVAFLFLSVFLAIELSDDTNARDANITLYMNQVRRMIPMDQSFIDR